MTRLRVAGLALAGGRSSRMGKDKAAQMLAGRALLAWTLAALDGVCETVAVSAAAGGGAEALGRHLGRRIVSDDLEHPRGPLAGVAAGLVWAAAEGFELLFTLPCDMPLVETRHLSILGAALMDANAAFAAVPGLPQPLCALWRVDAAASLVALLNDGRHPPVRVFLAEIGARAVPFPDPRPFRNLNTGEELAALRAEMARVRP